MSYMSSSASPAARVEVLRSVHKMWKVLELVRFTIKSPLLPIVRRIGYN